MSEPVDQWRRITPAYFAHCWNSIDRPHRKPILEALGSLGAPDIPGGVLELGCNSGVNLAACLHRWPHMRLWGVDANQAAIDYLKRQPEGDWITATCADIREWLPTIPDGQFGVALTAYCLAYIEPSQIAGVLAHMVRIARVGLVIAEPFGDPARIVAGIPEWRRPYLDLLPDPVNVMFCQQIEPPVERLNAVVAVGLR